MGKKDLDVSRWLGRDERRIKEFIGLLDERMQLKYVCTILARKWIDLFDLLIALPCTRLSNEEYSPGVALTMLQFVLECV